MSILWALVILMMACDRISPDHRWTPLPEDEVPENASTVLVEEYTGQFCINCPDAVRLLQQQKEVYKDKLIIVSMHAPRTGMTTPELASPEADRFAEKFGHERAVPGVMINRERIDGDRYYSQSPSLWPSEIRRRIMKPARYNVGIQEVKVNAEDNSITAQASFSIASPAGPSAVSSAGPSADPVAAGYRMDFWIVEDVIAPQDLPQGNKEDYFHHNVFRASLSDAQHGGNQADGNCRPDETYSLAAVLPENIKVLDNAKLVALLTDDISGTILAAALYPLGKGIEPDLVEPDPDKPGTDEPGTEPENPVEQSKTLHFSAESEHYISGSEIVVTKSLLFDPAHGKYLMDSPLTYVLPGKEYGFGTYEFTIKKLDHNDNPDCGLQMVCVDGRCLPSDDPECYKGTIEISSAEAVTRQAFSVHTFIQESLSEKADTFRYRISFWKDDVEISYLVLKLDFRPAA